MRAWERELDYEIMKNKKEIPRNKRLLLQLYMECWKRLNILLNCVRFAHKKKKKKKKIPSMMALESKCSTIRFPPVIEVVFGSELI
jgi:hypothetical protein